MNFIINGGISTTTVPSYSRDAILLTVNDSSLAGVSLNLYLTKDNIIVAYASPTVDNGKEKIRDLTLYNLQRRNFGGRIRRHPILKLTEVLEIFDKTSKILVLNLDQCADSEFFLQQLLELIDRYPNINIYIKSTCPSILKYLQKYIKNKG